MGAFASCCYGRRRKDRAEKEPLLPRHAQEVERPHEHDQIQKIARILAASSAGKYPSQKQINAAIQGLQRNVLYVQDSVDSGDEYYGPLSAKGRALLEDLHEACQAILQFGLEKNRALWNWC
jgi:hypothetical protein